MFKSQIEEDLKVVLHNIGYKLASFSLSIPEDPKFGDYSTNLALGLPKQSSKKSYQSPLEIANDILDSFGHPAYLERIEIAGPGFINFYLKDKRLIEILSEKISQSTQGTSLKRVLVEYASPNAFKPFHIGHLRNLVTGESIARLLKWQGDEIFKVTFNSDIGLSAAKAIWGIKKLHNEFVQSTDKSIREKVDFLGKAYVLGTERYENDPESKEEINQINIKLYQKDTEIMSIWQTTRSWSQAYFYSIYNRFGTEFDFEIWESEVEQEGKRIVQENIGKVFTKDNGAVIFQGEKYGLHTRVFITSTGNPTYEAKDVGLAFKQMEIFPFDEAVHIVGNEQSAYFKVIIKVLELLEKRLVGKKKHLAYGFVNLTTGKMSSRKGNVVKADDLIDQVKQEIREQFMKGSSPSEEKLIEQIAIGAIKFFLLKFSISSDITFDVKKSVSLQGDTGPYVQYTYARTQSVLENAEKLSRKEGKKEIDIQEEEREVLRQLEYAQMAFDQAAKELDPNKICFYLLNLSKSYNLFYQNCPILKSDNEFLRLEITKKVGETLKFGLNLLGIEAPQHM